MPRITFILPDGSVREIEAKNGLSVMENARNNGIEAIIAECGGAMACATCHVIVDREAYERLAAQTDDEAGMLEFAATPATETSRLSCQIEVNDLLDGARFTIPEEV
jgi:ferredoxin, 2Fe-2S